MDYEVAFFMVGEAARLTTAALFILAAYHAMRDWTLFEDIVEQYRVAPRGLSRFAARVVPPLESVTAAALVLPATSGAGSVLGLCLMTLFTGAIALNLARGRVTIDCGCGGATGQKLSNGLIVRNLLVALGLILAGTAPPTGAPAAVRRSE